MKILQCSNIHKKFINEGKTIHLLQGLNLELMEGESTSIQGKSGSGKSTLLSLLAGLDIPDQGDIFFQNKNWITLNEAEKTILRQQSLGLIFQTPYLIHTLTAWENVLLPLEWLGHTNAKARAKEVLTQVELDHRLNHRPEELSGGEAQRVALARALGPKPKLLLADEPNANLDFETGNRVMNYLFELAKNQGSTLLLVTHDRELAQKCKNQLYLEMGILKSRIS